MKKRQLILTMLPELSGCWEVNKLWTATVLTMTRLLSLYRKRCCIFSLICRTTLYFPHVLSGYASYKKKKKMGFLFPISLAFVHFSLNLSGPSVSVCFLPVWCFVFYSIPTDIRNHIENGIIIVLCVSYFILAFGWIIFKWMDWLVDRHVLFLFYTG